MSLLTRQVISERTIMIWFFYTVLASISTTVIAAVYVYFQYDCWPMANYRPGSINCLANIQPAYLKFAPMISGGIIGTVFTVITIQKDTGKIT